MWPFNKKNKKSKYEPKKVEKDLAKMSPAEIFDEQVICLEKAIEVFDQLPGCKVEAKKSRENLNALLNGKPFPHGLLN